MRAVTIAVLLSLLSCPALAQTFNEALGTDAGASVTSGDYDVFLGDRAGQFVTSAQYTTFVGYAAGRFATTTSNSDNVCIGYGAGAGKNGDYLTLSEADIITNYGSVPTVYGSDNVFVGREAGVVNTATDGTFVGTLAGYSNLSGTDNTFIGEEAGKYNTEGDDNVFVGEDAGYNNTTGDDNTGVGNAALRSNETGFSNTAVGSEAGYDIGSSYSSTYPDGMHNNTCVGAYAGGDIGVGVFNTMIGAQAGVNTELASANTFVGYAAGWDNNRTNVATDSGARNTYVGAGAGAPNRTGNDNVVVGASMDSGNLKSSYCKPYNSWSTYSECVDWQSGDTEVHRNVVMGSSVDFDDNDVVLLGYNIKSTENRTIVIGSGAQGTHVDSIVIGYGATSHANDTVVIGNADTVSWDPGADGATSLGTSTYRFSDVVSETFSAMGDEATAATLTFGADLGTDNDDYWQFAAADGGDFTLSTFADGAYAAVLTVANTGNATLAGDLTLNSDERLKVNVAPIHGAMELLDTVEAVTFEWLPELGRTAGLRMGFIAQQVREVLPELVVEGREGILSVNYLGFVPLLANALQELRDAQEERFLAQDREMVLLRQQVEVQQRQIDLLTRQMALLQAESN